MGGDSNGKGEEAEEEGRKEERKERRGRMVDHQRGWAPQAQEARKKRF